MKSDVSKIHIHGLYSDFFLLFDKIITVYKITCLIIPNCACNISRNWSEL